MESSSPSTGAVAARRLPSSQRRLIEPPVPCGSRYKLHAKAPSQFVLPNVAYTSPQLRKSRNWSPSICAAKEKLSLAVPSNCRSGSSTRIGPEEEA